MQERDSMRARERQQAKEGRGQYASKRGTWTACKQERDVDSMQAREGQHANSTHERDSMQTARKRGRARKQDQGSKQERDVDSMTERNRMQGTACKSGSSYERV
jgi:hypothetical protein